MVCISPLAKTSRCQFPRPTAPRGLRLDSGKTWLAPPAQICQFLRYATLHEANCQNCIDGQATLVLQQLNASRPKPKTIYANDIAPQVPIAAGQSHGLFTRT